MLKRVKLFLRGGVVFFYSKLFVKKYFSDFNKFLFYLSLKGIGILNYKTKKDSGEQYFIKKLGSFYKNQKIIVFDIGANRGDYTSMILEEKLNADVYAFEPHPKTFLHLKAMAKGKPNVALINKGCGDTNSKMTMYDLKNNNGSELATLHKDVIKSFYNSKCIETSVDTIKLDDFCVKNNITKINLLKIDTEGNEFNVLKGSADLLKKEAIDIIHFEFNFMNIVSRVFFKDFYDLLDEYTFFRLLPDGMVNLGKYDPLYEIFSFQNIVAIKKSIAGSFN